MKLFKDYDYTKPIPFLMPTKVTWVVFTPLYVSFFIIAYYRDFFEFSVIGEGLIRANSTDPFFIKHASYLFDGYTWVFVLLVWIVASYVIASLISFVVLKLFPASLRFK